MFTCWPPIILPSYSAEHTIYREVLQNANDANAMAVEIIFGETVVAEQTPIVNSIILRNNGRPFDKNDWNRLKKIAEGNPDEQKVAAPARRKTDYLDWFLWMSGESCLAFYWKGDQLYARPGATPAEFDGSWTTIYLKLRDPIERMHLDSFAHFLAKSILFTQYLEKVSVRSGTDLLFSVSKKRSSPSALSISPSSLLSSTSTKPAGLFTIKSGETQAIQLDLDKRYVSEAPKADRSLLSSIWSIAKNIAKDKQTRKDEDAAMRPGIFTLFLHIINCEVKVSPSSAFSASMERITKKKPSSHLKMSLLYSTFDEVEASSDLIRKAKHPVLCGVLPEVEAGKVFIGFETHQTTGCAIHVAGPFVPTVERESLDFVDKTLSQWNEELLRVCSKIIRIIYETEMQAMRKLFPQKTSNQPDEYWQRSRHILRSFGSGQSSPSPAPSHVIIHEFFSCARTALLLPSSVGIVPITDLRSIPSSLESFAKDIPLLDYAKLQGVDRMIKMVTSFSEIPDASFSEIMHSLHGRKLTDSELASCLEWIIVLHQKGQLGGRHFYSMVSNLLVPVGQSSAGQFAKLSSVTHYPSGPIMYESGMPIPNYCLSPKIAERIPGYDLGAVFNLKELGLCDWASDLVKGDFLTDAGRAEKFIIFLSKNFAGISDHDKAMIANLLANIPVVPTVHGLKIPSQSYLEAVKVFGNVSVVSFKERWVVSDSFLIALGVQSHIDVAQIFSKLDHLDWDHRQLIKYLVSIKSQLSSDELGILRAAKVFPAIGTKNERFKLEELYLDHPVVRFMDLFIIDWKGGEAPSPHSESAVFMTKLGLRTVVPWELLLRKVADANSSQRVTLLKYFIDHYDSDYRNSYNAKSIDFDFVPLKDDAALSRPLETFSDDGVALLGFKVFHPELKSFASYFGIKPRPAVDLIVIQICNRAFDRSRAAEVFSYLSTMLRDFNSNHYRQLSHAPFIPTEGTLKWGRPIDLFFSKGKFDLGEVFQVINFGEHSKPFLSACGVEDEPKAAHIANRICEEPAGYLKQLGAETYMDLLRWLALQFAHLPNDSITALKTSKALLGLDYSVAADEKVANDVIQSKFVLATAQSLYIIDDTISQQVFGCLAVPADSTIEHLYTKLGSKLLSSCVKMSWKFMGIPTGTHEAVNLQKQIQMRAPLLVAEQPSASKQNKQALSRLLSVEVGMVDSISIARMFEGKTHNQPTTACLKTETLLLVTSDYDFFDVANALAKVIYMDHSRLPDALLISTLLSSSLASLRAKGFPVDRVLGRKPAKTVIPEDSEIVNAPPPYREPVKPEPTPPKPTPVKSEEHMPTLKPQQMTPEKHDGSIGRKTAGILGAIKDAIRDRTMRTPTKTPSLPGPVDDNGMRSTLQQSISKLREHNRQAIHDEPRVEPTPPPSVSADSYCEVIPGHSLRYIGTVGSVPIYTAVSEPVNQTTALLELPLMHQFVAELSRLASVFQASPSTLHVFYDTSSVAIAFNRNKTLFFNYAHYQRQVEAEVPAVQLQASWYITFCHELAHNFIGYVSLVHYFDFRPHDERHIYYMSCFAETYLDRFISGM
ncbi:hypothetical protein PSACC_02677 [Paramicrosporidium saccamoebae]|uniref:Uncharacterized protein n=1 Tax=Paramicrosporidium saccamoebae TaxID=1246581 RepID=A0A2H9TIK0_9FUNG|nr:hypothetical protein PSACC_02677 [Paramicrosporidium saccamoebae]